MNTSERVEILLWFLVAIIVLTIACLSDHGP